MGDSDLTKELVKMVQDNKTANEVLKVTMENLKETLIEIKDFMKEVSNGYVTIRDFDENKELKEKEHNSIWERIKRLEWGFIVGSGAILSTFLGLIIWAIFQK